MGNMLGYDVYSKYPNTVKWRPLFEALNFSARDVGRLHRAFVDISGTGTTVINQDQLLDFLDVDRNKFTKRVFSIFDEDGSGTIDFREFVISLYNYCTLGNSTLALFAFDLYDRDSSGVIDSTEVDMMLRDIYGKRFKKNKHAQRIGDKIASMRNVEFDKDVFREFLRKHPTMLFPAFEIQKKIKKKCLGVGFWKRYTARRVELCNGTYMSVGQLIDTLMNTKGPSRSSRLINQYTSSISESFQTPDDSADTRGKTKGKGRKTKDVHYVGATYQRISDEPNSGTAGDTHRRKPTRRQLERQESLDMFARSLGHLAERKSSVGAVDTDTIITTTPSGNQEEVSNSRRRPSFSRAETLSHEDDNISSRRQTFPPSDDKGHKVRTFDRRASTGTTSAAGNNKVKPPPQRKVTRRVVRQVSVASPSAATAAVVIPEQKKASEHHRRRLFAQSVSV